MKFIDLFCGIGGFRIAFESVSAECVFSSDIDKFACETYRLNFREFPLSNVSEIKSNEIGDFDILCAGFPCQPFSIAGFRKGFQDTRGTLFFDIERILRDKKPKAFILENVKGLINHDNGRTLKTMLNILGKKVNGLVNFYTCKNNLGYNVFYKVLNSKFYGMPQNRERIYIIGFRDENVLFNFPKPFKNGINLDTVIEENISDHNISSIAKQNIKINLLKHDKYKEIKDLDFLLAYEIRKSRCSFRFDNLSPTLTAKMGTGGNNVPVIVKYMRKFTVKECLRIQGYPENFKIKSNNSQSYKQIGNSVSVPVIKLLANQIVKKLNTT